MYAIENYRKIWVFLQFSYFDIFLSTNFAENMNSALPSNEILPYFEEVLVNALLLQNYGDFWINVMRNELCALKFRKMHTKSEKNIKNFILSFFINQDVKECSHYFNSSVL